MVIEVLSRSNTVNEIREKATLCLSTGAQEFWIVDPARKRITVMSLQAAMAIYEHGDRMPLQLFGGELPVKIFSSDRVRYPRVAAVRYFSARSGRK